MFLLGDELSLELRVTNFELSFTFNLSLFFSPNSVTRSGSLALHGVNPNYFRKKSVMFSKIFDNNIENGSRTAIDKKVF